jgi:hypothetical protein
MSRDVCVKDIPELRDAIPSKEGLLNDLKKIPLGSFIAFKDEMLLPTWVSELSANLKTIHGYFAEVPTPDVKPMLWSYPQIMFGVWRQEEVEATNKEWNALKANEVLMQIQELILTANGVLNPKPSNNKSHVVENVEDVEDEEDAYDIDDEDTESQDDDVGAFYARDIERGDVVAILCTEGDDNIKLPNTNTHIWLCHVSKVKPWEKPAKVRRRTSDEGSPSTPYEVSGHLYQGSINNLVYGSFTTLIVADAGIIHIFDGKTIKDPRHLKLENNVIKEMCEYVSSWDD